MSDRRNNAGAAAPAAQRPTARPAARPARRGSWLSVPDNRYAAIKWALLAALLVYAVLIVGANSARNVAFSAIEGRMRGAPGLEELHSLDENALQERLGTTPEGCEGFLMYGSDDVMNVDELLIVKGPAAALDRLETAVRGRVEAQLDVFRSYGVDQKQLLEAARVTRRGSYLFYAVGAASDAWEDAFLSAIR